LALLEALSLSLLDEEFIKVASLFGGEDAVRVVKVLAKIKEGTDDVIAAESGVRLNTVRKILYKLYDHALVSATRIRDDKTGWYIFYWKLQPDQLDAFIRSRKRRTLDKLKSRLEYERGHSFFICKKCLDVRVPFEEAMESAFRCPKCGGQLTGTDNSRMIEYLSDLISKLERELVE